MKILIKEQSTKKWDYTVVCFAVLLRILTFFLCQVKNTADSLEYIHINGFQWLTGTVDRYRLPLYPMLIEVCQQIAGSRYLIAVCLVQLVVSIASLIALYALFKKLSDKQYIYLPLFILCSASVVMGNWDKLILTESLSLSLTVFLLWGLVCYIKETKLRYLVVAIVASGLGAFLRATFALYTGAIFVFLLLQLCFPGSKESGKLCRNNAIKGLIITAVPIVLIFCYALVFSLQHGSFTLSHSGLGQQLHIVVEKGYYTDSTDEEIKQDIQHILDTKLPDEITDQEQATMTDQKYIDTLQEFFQSIYNRNESIAEYDHIYLARCYIMQTYEAKRVSAFVKEAKSANLLHYLMQRPGDALGIFSANYTAYKSGTVVKWLQAIPKLFLNLPDFCLLQAMLVGVVELAVFVYLLLKKKLLDWIHLGFGTMIVATGVLSLLGTNAEFARTAVTAYPMMFAVFVIWINFAVSLIVRREKAC